MKIIFLKGRNMLTQNIPSKRENARVSLEDASGFLSCFFRMMFYAISFAGLFLIKVRCRRLSYINSPSRCRSVSPFPPPKTPNAPSFCLSSFWQHPSLSLSSRQIAHHMFDTVRESRENKTIIKTNAYNALAANSTQRMLVFSPSLHGDTFPRRLPLLREGQH